LQFAVARLGANQTVGRVVGKDEFQHCATCVENADGIGFHHHTFGTDGNAGGGKVSTTFYFHHTDTTSARIVFNVEVM
jgi:hypothetical protein